MKNLKNILIPVNFSDHSENAIRTGIAMCARHGSVLHLLYIRKHNNFAIPPGKNSQLLRIILEAETELQNRLEYQAKKIQRDHHINCFYHTAGGPFNPTVATIAADFYCDLIIIEKARNPKSFSLLNNNSVYKLLSRVACPILSIPPAETQSDFKRILLPVRPLHQGLQKLEIALSIIRKNNSKVLLFGSVRRKNREYDSEIIKKLIQKASLLMRSDRINIEKEIKLTEDTAREVIGKAIEKKSDLIIISASIEKGLKSFFVSNYTKRVIDNSPVPILCVKTY